MKSECHELKGFTGSFRCSSRKGTEETAMHILAKASKGMHGGYIQNEAHRGQLQAAADRVVDKQLQQALRGGVGFHHGNLEPQDRATVENLFLHRAILVGNFTSPICALPVFAEPY